MINICTHCGEEFKCLSKQRLLCQHCMECTCGIRIRKFSLKKHLKTRKHYVNLGIPYFKTKYFIKCKCGSRIGINTINEHKKTNKHNDQISLLNPITLFYHSNFLINIKI